MASGFTKYIITGHIVEVYKYKNYFHGKGGNTGIKKGCADLESKLKKGSEYQKAPISGIVSYRVDGLEESLKPENFNEMNEQFFKNLELKTGQIISASNESGKIIDNFKCYIAVTLDSKEAMEALLSVPVLLPAPRLCFYWLLKGLL